MLMQAIVTMLLAMRGVCKVGDRKRQGMALHASSLAYLGEKNTPAAIDCGLQALAIYRDIGEPRLHGMIWPVLAN